LVYTGTAYIFSINESPLAACGVKIDTAKSGTTNGYGGDVSATNARTTAYSVTVYLTNLDSTYETYNNQYTLSYRIDKAKYNLSGLSWPAVNELEYNGKSQGMELQGVLPAGLQIASYSGNGNIPVSKYTTTVTFSVADTHNNNYEIPVDGDKNTYDGDFDFSYDWYIIQATLNVTWKDDNNGNVDEYTLPTLNKIGDLDVSSMVNYTYYDKDNNQITSLPKKDEVVEETRYRAVATLTGANNTNYKFATGNSVEYSFTIGKNKYAVKLILQWNGENLDGKELKYTGSAYSPKIEITEALGGILVADITLRYYKDGSTSFTTDAPSTVGHYRIEVTLNNGGDDNYIDRDSAEFEFDIIKADFDVSGLKWQYTHGEVTATYDFDQNKWLDVNGDEISPIEYDKTSHTLTLVGKDDIANLQIDVIGYEYTDASDDYTAQITFAYDTVNYNAPDFPTTLSWSIAKATIDTSAVVWGYDDGDGVDKVYTE
ncbi:MAG: hypothetical protein K2K24_02630, partial [Clostridia bacterium]|nr:hypothetical protein [Clostridia bacterium]